PSRSGSWRHGRFLGQSIGNETAEAPGRGYPVESIPCFKKIGYLAARKAAFGSIIGELVAVESGQALRSAKPQEAFGVLHNAVYVVAGQTISRCVGPDRQPFRFGLADDEDAQQRRNAKSREKCSVVSTAQDVISFSVEV